MNDSVTSVYLPIKALEDDVYLPNGAPAAILASGEELPKAQIVILTEETNQFICADDFLDT